MKRIVMVLVLLLSAAAVPAQAATEKETDTYKYLDLFGVVFERVRSGYVEKVTDKKLIESAINGMLQALDPHSSYLSTDSFKEMQVNTTGKFGGLGIQVTTERGIVKVISPIDDYPHQRQAYHRHFVAGCSETDARTGRLQDHGPDTS